MSAFKEMVARDRKNVFLDTFFFSEVYTVEGKEIQIVVDNETLKERQAGQDLAVAESNTLFFASVEDVPKRAVGESLNINGRECIVDDWKEEMGVVEVALREAIVM